LSYGTLGGSAQANFAFLGFLKSCDHGERPIAEAVQLTRLPEGRRHRGQLVPKATSL
jgi:hypothetical protein